MLPHLDAAHNLARFLSRDPDAAQDIVQDAFLRAFRSFGDFRGGHPRAWILAIVSNCHRNWCRERRRVSGFEAVDAISHDSEGTEDDRIEEAGSAFATVDATPETELIRRTEAEAVRALLDVMPEPFREVLVLRELEEMSYRDIAEVTATPIGTVMSRLCRARKLFGAAWQARNSAKGDGT